MRHQKPICLTLILLLAFWTPVGACCGTAGAGASEAGSAGDAGEMLAHVCHGVPESNTSDEPEPKSCDDHPCTCETHLIGVCQSHTLEAKPVPSSSNHLLSWLLSLAPIQPQNLLPYTFFADCLEADDALPPPVPAPTLLALSCQLTL